MWYQFSFSENIFEIVKYLTKSEDKSKSAICGKRFQEKHAINDLDTFMIFLDI